MKLIMFLTSLMMLVGTVVRMERSQMISTNRRAVLTECTA